ncbi:uncharacterized protein G2W53_036488 [Senna tora]|uniref:Uncharacterized protein n=1 Tax=Senna tora TaxID=362788 RepID=A0A834SVZ5_9FABA|nr:uncharacterized protein G2W53_036488 [Senna tora]
MGKGIGKVATRCLVGDKKKKEHPSFPTWRDVDFL